jgi:large subunit ribosomal protein L12
LNFEMTDSYMYAALVLHKAGKKVDEAGLTSVVKAAGVDVDTVKVKALASALSEINIDEALKNAATMAVAAAPAAAAPAAKAEEKPKVEEKKEEEALAGLASLFGSALWRRISTRIHGIFSELPWGLTPLFCQLFLGQHGPR